MIEEETKKVTVTEENIREVIETILKHSNISDLDVYNNLFENRVSIFKYVLESYFKKVEGRSCCADKARYVAKMVDKTLKDNKYYPLQETYRDYQNRGGDIGGITELDEVAYWCPKTMWNTKQALEIIHKSIKFKEE